MKITYGLSVQPISAGLAEELISLSADVFGSVDRTDELWRFENMPDLTCFEARMDERLVGFKLGYAVTSLRYYSWLGGVQPSFRRLGIARELMTRQHEWIGSRGYQQIETEAVQDNQGMTQLNGSAGFVAVGTKRTESDSRIIYRKTLRLR